MGVDAIYLLSEKKQIRRVIVWGAYELIHDEATYELDAEIASEYDARPGEFLAFFDVDARLRLFEIDSAEKDERRNVTSITATDAAVAELAHLIVPEIRLTGATSEQAALAALGGSGWQLGETGAQGTSDISAYRDTRWKVLRDIAVQYQARVTPYFTIEDGKITGRYVDVTARENVFRGRLFEGRSGGAQIYVTKSGAPITRMYGVGKAVGEEDPPTCVTFADVVWSKANGDPADKPAGQTYIEDEDAIALYGEGREGVFTDKYAEEPAKLLEKTWAELQKKKQPKITGTATASDMEHIPGYEHMIVRLHDMVWVRTKTGEDLQAVVINVKRNYLRRGLTKITIGEEADDSGLIAKIAKLSSTSTSLSKSSSAQNNRYIETKRLIQLNAETIQMNARLIEANAEEIYLTARKTDEATGRLTEAELELYGDGTTARAGLVARMNGNEASIRTIVDEMGSRVTIEALEIELRGYVTAYEFESEMAKIDNLFAGYTAAAKMIITNLNALSMTFDGLPVMWQNLSIPTGGSIPALSGYNVRLGDGTTAMLYAFNSTNRTISLSKDNVSVMAATT